MPENSTEGGVALWNWRELTLMAGFEPARRMVHESWRFSPSSQLSGSPNGPPANLLDGSKTSGFCFRQSF